MFFHKLDYLRTQAEVFLKMLNDMRRRLKEIPVDSAAAQQYRYLREATSHDSAYMHIIMQGV